MKDEQAFPFQSRQDHEKFNAAQMGLTKRHWFAGIALQGILAKGEISGGHHETAAQQAVLLADAIIAELSK